METVYRDYAPQGVKFYYIYKALAHPENNGYVAPFNLNERLMHVAEAKRTLQTEIPWICDTMDNDLKHQLGDRPNSEFLIDPQGQVVVARQWSNPAQLRSDLERYVGKAPTLTRVSDLDMKAPPPLEKVATGIVPRLRLPGAMQPVLIEPQESAEPHYVKLRAEMGRDQLYLGFFLDPLYKVHWNNEAPAIQYELEAPEGLQLSPLTGSGPKVGEKADADPREFLVRLQGNSREPIRLKVSYFACDDAGTFCKRVEQEYLITLERDRDGGSRRSSGGRGGPGGRSGRGGPGGAPGGFTDRAEMMKQMLPRLPLFQALDRDRDGELSAAELEAAPSNLKRLDRDRDGNIGQQELRPSRSRGR